MRDWKGRLDKLTPRWNGKPTLHSSSWETPVYYHYGTSVDGYSSAILLYSDVLASQTLDTNFTKYPNTAPFTHVGDDRVTSLPVGREDSYGFKGRLLRTPRFVRVINELGWYYSEHYPATIFNDSVNYRTYLESIFLTPPFAGPGNQETNCIDYYKDFGDAIYDFCKTNDIGLAFMRPDQITVGAGLPQYTGPTQHVPNNIPIISAGQNPGTSFFPYAHPGRWMFNLIPRYSLAGVSTNNIATSPYWKSSYGDPNQFVITKDQEKYIVGGEVLNIVFATDAYMAYHGVDVTPFRPDDPNHTDVGNRDCMMEDIDTIKRRAEYFKKYGNIVINSPKNPMFFPLWLGESVFDWSNSGVAWCLNDAQPHFREVESLLSAYNTKMLIRNVSFGSAPTPQHAIYENNHLTFAGPQVSVDDIMQEVHSFWGL